jgi:hypothetical protein
VADVQNVNLVFAHGEEDPVFVPAATVENLADLAVEKFALRRKRGAFGKNIQRENSANN